MSTTRDVIIQSERFDQAAAFYRDVLGFQPTVENERLVGFETGSFQLFVEPGSRPGAVFDIEFDDLAAAKRLLLAHRAATCATRTVCCSTSRSAKAARGCPQASIRASIRAVALPSNRSASSLEPPSA